MRYKDVTILDKQIKESEAPQTVEKRYAKPELIRIGGNAAEGKTLPGSEATVITVASTTFGGTVPNARLQGPS